MNLKADSTEAIDPFNWGNTPLFNPRIQRWSDHFIWSSDATIVEGLTTISRATIICLRMNNPVIVVARRRWTISGGILLMIDFKGFSALIEQLSLYPLENEEWKKGS